MGLVRTVQNNEAPVQSLVGIVWMETCNNMSSQKKIQNLLDKDLFGDHKVRLFQGLTKFIQKINTLDTM